jgi:carbon storage regulator CsrA
MLIIERKSKEGILIETPEGMVRIRIHEITGDRVRFAFGASKRIVIVRQEVHHGKEK